MTRTLMLLALLTSAAHAAITVAPGYALRHIPTPGVVQGGVVRSGNVILVGQGAYGPGLERIVRLDGTVATTVADGFGSLGGLDLNAAGTLYAADNCYTGDFGCAAAITGDTLYAVPNALTRSTALAAGTATVLPNGTIPFAQDVLVVPAGVLVSNGAGPGAGRVLQVVGNTASNLITGLDYAAGLALQGTTLLVGNANFPSPGSVKKYSLAGASLGNLVTGLSSVYGVAVDGDGKVLVTGGTAPDFSGSIQAVSSGGAVTERARGFGFSSDIFYDASRDAALVLDFGVSEIAAICRDGNTDGLCDADCATPVTFSAVTVKVSGVDTPAGDDKLKLKGELSLANPAINPISSGLKVWLDDANRTVVADIVLPAGFYDSATHSGWRVNAAATAWTFKHPTGVVGITRASVRKVGGTAGTFRIKLTGKKAGYAFAGSTSPLRVGIALSATQCASGTMVCSASGNARTCE